MDQVFKKKTAEELKKESRNFFSRQARVYDRILVLERPVHNRIIEKLNLYPHHSVLDVGCGTGALLSLIAKKKADAKLSGLDIAPGMIHEAKERLGERAELVVGEVENLPWNDSSFDVVVSTYAFHHFPRPKVALAEIKRVLKPGGVLIIGDIWLPPPLRQLLNLLIRYSKTGDVRSYAKSEIISLLRDSDFRSINWEPVYTVSSLVTARKL